MAIHDQSAESSFRVQCFISQTLLTSTNQALTKSRCEILPASVP